MNITVIAVDIEAVTKGKNTWEAMTVTYKDKDNKATAKKLVSFSTPKEVWEALANSNKGDSFSIEATKDDKGYWQWAGISRQDAVVGEQKPPTKSPVKPTYETPEERAARQVLIVRQSSLSSAVDLLKDHGKPEERTKEKVVEVAKFFESYVFHGCTQDPFNDSIE